MEDSPVTTLIYIIKMPFVLALYFLYMLLTIFIPSKYVSRFINIESIEFHLNYYFNNSLYLKLIALILTIIIFVFMID